MLLKDKKNLKCVEIYQLFMVEPLDKFRLGITPRGARGDL
jgi:hypothetical protein